MSRPRVLAHLSDLHFGLSRRLERRCAELVAALVAADVDHVVVTGDVTDRGRIDEFERFLACFGPLGRRLSVVPGNHDRLGDDAAELTMAGRRVLVRASAGLHLVLVDSTRDHAMFPFVAHGELTEADCAAIVAGCDAAEPGALVVVAMHHHPLPLPEESTLELIGSALGLPFGGSLERGPALVERLRGRCDLVLHGHRHVPHEAVLPGRRPLWVVNAGSSPALGRARVYRHAGGRLVVGPRWFDGAAVVEPRVAP